MQTGKSEIKTPIEVDRHIQRLKPHYGIRMLRIISDLFYATGWGQATFSTELVSTVTKGKHRKAMNFPPPQGWRKNVCERLANRYLNSAKKQITTEEEDQLRGRLHFTRYRTEEVFEDEDFALFIESLIPLDMLKEIYRHISISELPIPENPKKELTHPKDSFNFRKGMHKAKEKLNASEAEAIKRHLRKKIVFKNSQTNDLHITPEEDAREKQITAKSEMGTTAKLNFVRAESSVIYFWLLFLEEEVHQFNSKEHLLKFFEELKRESTTMQGLWEAEEFDVENFEKILHRIELKFPKKEEPRKSKNQPK